MNKVLVRSDDKTVFPINPETLEALSTGYYDAYCFADPEPGVTYISFNEWCNLRNKQWDREMKTSRGYSRIGLGNV